MLLIIILILDCSAAVRKDQEHDQDPQQLRGRHAARDTEFVLDICASNYPGSFISTLVILSVAKDL